MNIDIAKYEVNKRFVHKWYNSQAVKDPGRAIASMATATSVPCIVIAYWIGEIDGFTPEIIARIQALKEFYRYDEIINKPASAPI